MAPDIPENNMPAEQDNMPVEQDNMPVEQEHIPTRVEQLRVILDDIGDILTHLEVTNHQSNALEHLQIAYNVAYAQWEEAYHQLANQV